jgi:signal transduction histidine kinase
MPEGGTLRLHVSEATDWVSKRRGPSIAVIDTGAGIKPEDAQRLFEPFYSTKAAKGTGLGLWISKGILQKYSGRISYRSYRRNGGCVTCFRVFIPGNGTLNLVPDVVDEAETSARKLSSKPEDSGWPSTASTNRAVPAAL